MNKDNTSSVGLVRGLRSDASGMPGIRPRDAACAERQQDFARLLGRASDTPSSTGGGPAAGENASGVRSDRGKAARDLVSIALVQPILKQLRQSNNAAAPFAPGPMEKQFGTFLDAQYANSLVKSGNFGLVSAVQRWMSERDRAPVSGAALAPLDRQAAASVRSSADVMSQGAVK